MSAAGPASEKSVRAGWVPPAVLVGMAAAIIAGAALTGVRALFIGGCVLAAVLVFIAGIVLPAARSWPMVARRILAGVVAAAIGLCSIYTPILLLRRQLSEPRWQAATASSDPALLAAAGRVFVLDRYSFTVYEADTGQTAAVVASPRQNPIDSVVVGQDGSFATYRGDDNKGRITYYSANGTKRWTVDAGDDPSALSPVWAIADGYVIIHSWYRKPGAAPDDDRNLLRAIGPDGHQAWSEPTPDGSYLVPAVSAGQSSPGSWFHAAIQVAPTVVVSAGEEKGPITVRSAQGKRIDATRGELLGIAKDTIYVRGDNGRVTARRDGQRLWRGDRLRLSDEEFGVTYSQKWIHLVQGKDRYLISRSDGTVHKLAAADIDVMADLVLRRAEDGYTAIDPATGRTRWTYDFARGTHKCHDIDAGAQTLVIECRPGSLARLADTGDRAYQLDILDLATGRRTGRVILTPFHSSTWSTNYQPVREAVSVGPGRVVLTELPNKLQALG